MGVATSRVSPLEWTNTGRLVPVAMIESHRDSSRSDQGIRRATSPGSGWACSEVCGEACGGACGEACGEAVGEDDSGSAVCMASPPAPAPRVSWDQLERLHHIGSGEFCDVWAAQLTSLGSTRCSAPVAVKARAALEP